MDWGIRPTGEVHGPPQPDEGHVEAHRGGDVAVGGDRGLEIHKVYPLWAW